MEAPIPETFVGVDVSKAEPAVAVGDDGPAFTLPNTPEGHAGLAARLSPLRPRPRPGAAARELEALLARRQLAGMRTMEADRPAATPSRRVARDLEAHVRRLESHLEGVDRELDEKIRSSPAWREKDDLLREAPGIGPVLSRTLLAALPELGRLTGGRIAALVGAAPMAAESGAWRGRRRIQGAASRSATPCTWPPSRPAASTPRCGRSARRRPDRRPRRTGRSSGRPARSRRPPGPGARPPQPERAHSSSGPKQASGSRSRRDRPRFEAAGR
ncbi:transposase [Paludisphaera mucosa]|uniref:transposase n=1 Tax=Paludisphaera mucosa TaxID=3030827 RepID=UPI003F60FED1